MDLDSQIAKDIEEINNQCKKWMGDEWKHDLDTSNVSFGLSVGQQYRYYMDFLGETLFVEGKVLSNDGVTAIIRVTHRYMECESEVLDYNEVRRYFPFFVDAETKKTIEYLCLDVKTERNLFFRDSDNDTIMWQHSDDDGNYSLIPADVVPFRLDRIKQLFILELEKRAAEEKVKADSRPGPHVNIDLADASIEEMYKEYDEAKDIDDNELKCSLKRSVYWLNNRNCAIISAWRGNYTRAENNERNQNLQKSLRTYGYGVIRVKGCYAEIGKQTEKENSFLVFDLEDSHDFKDKIYELSERYEQDCFLFKPINEEIAYLIGTNDNYGKEKIDIAGYLRVNSLGAEHYSEIGSGRITFEK